MRAIAKDLYCFESTLKMPGNVVLPIRMTLAVLKGNKIWVHSPIGLTPEQISQIHSLGEISYIVAPNTFHHLHIRKMVEIAPQAKLYAPKDLIKKRPTLTFHQDFETMTEIPWGETIGLSPILGMPLFKECVFFHHPSKTLICADLVFNLHEFRTRWERIFWWLNGGTSQPIATRFFKLNIRQRATFKKSLQNILHWPIDRVIMAHGQIIEARGSETLRHLYRDYLK